MIQSNNGMEEFQKVISTLSVHKHIKIHSVNIVEHRETWGLANRLIHDYLFAYIRSGSGYYIFEQLKAPIEKGRIVIIGPNMDHCAVHGESAPSLISIRFGIYNQENLLLENISNPFAISDTTKNTDLFLQSFERLYRHYKLKNVNELHDQICSILVLYLLNESLLEMESNLVKNKQYDMRLESVKLYIDKNIYSPISFEKLCSIAGLSKQYLTRLFKRQFSITPKKYIFQAKMNEAYQIMTQSSCSIKEIAAILGYADQFIFSNQFKEHFGYTPSDVRKEL